MHYKLAIAALLALAGCNIGIIGAAIGSAVSPGPYDPEMLAASLDTRAIRTVGCLDLGFAVTERFDRSLLGVFIGNRCAHAERLDLQLLEVRASGLDGAPRSAAISDPRHELVARHVGGLEHGVERIGIGPLDGVSRICLDVALVAPEGKDAAPVCFVRADGGWYAT